MLRSYKQIYPLIRGQDAWQVAVGLQKLGIFKELPVLPAITGSPAGHTNLWKHI